MQILEHSKMHRLRVVFVIFVMFGAAFLIAAHSHDDTEDVHCAVCRIINNQAVALGGWHLGLGAALLVTNAREFDYLATVQLGYHVKWEKLFK